MTISVDRCTRLVPPLADLVEGPLAVLDAAVSLGRDALVAARPARGVLGHLDPRVTPDGLLAPLPLQLLLVGHQRLELLGERVAVFQEPELLIHKV